MCRKRRIAPVAIGTQVVDDDNIVECYRRIIRIRHVHFGDADFASGPTGSVSDLVNFIVLAGRKTEQSIIGNARYSFDGARSAGYRLVQVVDYIGKLGATVRVTTAREACAYLDRPAIDVVKRFLSTRRQRRVIIIVIRVFALHPQILDHADWVHVFLRQGQIWRAAGESGLVETVPPDSPIGCNDMLVAE